METFQTVIDYNPEVEYSYNDLSEKLAEGKRDTVKEIGINPIAQKWTVTISGELNNVLAAQHFIANHLGSRRFIWDTPAGETIYVRCEESSLNYHSPVTAKLTLEFKQVFQP